MAALETDIAARRNTKKTGTQTGGKSVGHERDMVCAVDRLPVESGQATGKSPVDRAKRGSKIHLLVDGCGAPLAVYITGANMHDKWLVDDLIISIVVPDLTRPKLNNIYALTEATTSRMSISL